MLAVQVAPHQHAACTGAAARLLGELERDPLGRDDIVAADDALFFDAENVLERDAAPQDEGRDGIGRRAPELGIEGGQEVFVQVAIGRRDGCNARNPRIRSPADPAACDS